MRGNDASGNGSFNVFWVPTFINGINPSGLPFATTGSNTFNGNQIVSGAVDIQNSLSASLPQGYVWVGDASNRTAVVPTSSFGSTLPSGVISGSQQITALGFVSSSITGSSLVTASVNVNVITFTKGDSSTFDITVAASGSIAPGTISGSAQITALGFVSSSVTASSLVTASFSGNTLTFTKGDASTFGIVIPDVSGSGTAFANPSVESISGSLLITANTFTSGAANLLHISASAQNQANLVFKNNNNVGTTIVSGSNNIYVNPTIPSAGRINYIGGTSNLFLNGQGQQLPTITGSAASVSGARPTMNANIIAGTQVWTINQAVNPGAHTYNNNMLLGTTTWTHNMLGNTGTVVISNNIGQNSAFNINSPSASAANVLAGVSGSNALTILNNIVGNGTLTYNGPVSSSTHQIVGNTVQGSLTMNMQSQSKAISLSANNINGILILTDNTVFAPTLGSQTNVNNNIVNGTITVTNIASASANIVSNNLNGFTITNEYNSSTNGTTGRIFALQGNALLGFLGNNIYLSGSANGTGTTNDRGRGLYGNIMGGSRISASVIGDGNKNLLASAVIGQGLNIYGTSLYDASNAAAAGGQNGGSAFFGRWNAEDGNRANSSETVFVVGTGNSGSAGITRKTGFLIDSGSNSFFEGTLNVSGSTSFTGSAPTILSSSFSGSLITNLTDTYTDVSAVNQIVTLTSASYASLVTGSLTNPNTLYIVSGSTQVNPAFPYTGSAVITGSLTVIGNTTLSGSAFINNLQNGISDVVVTYNNSTGELRKSTIADVISQSFDGGEFWSTVTQSGSAGVSGSITFNNSGSVAGVSLVNSNRITMAQAGTYNIQFSAQIETSAGADTVHMWFKKNGNNISDSASKAKLANNTAQIMTVNIFDTCVANDYYELAYQTLNGNATVLYEAATGNIPAVPSVILTVQQIR
jgi:hypothetical protein